MPSRSLYRKRIFFRVPVKNINNSNRSSSTNTNKAGFSSGITTPSDHKGATANLYDIKELVYDPSKDPNVAPPVGDDVWREIVNVFKKEPPTDGGPKSYNVSSKILSTVAALQEVLKAHYAKEVEFSKALFDTLRSCLKKQGLIEECQNQDETEQHKEAIIFTYGTSKDFDYAIGIKREGNGEQVEGNGEQVEGNGEQDEGNGEQGATDKSGSKMTGNGLKKTGSGLAANSKLNHCVCLLRREKGKKGAFNGKWKVVDCLAAVELKLAGTVYSCDAFKNDVKGKDAEKLLEETLCSTRGSLAQVMLYTMSWVIPSLAKIGQLNDSVPWCVIVGTKQEKDPSTASKKTPPLISRWCRWVSGNIYVPDICGDKFKYAMTGFERLNVDENEATLNHAVSIYLGTLLFGLRAARVWLDALRDKKTCETGITSGKRVCIGNIELLNLELRGRPNGFVETDPNYSRERWYWKASQGEVFTGKLNIHQVIQESGLDDKSLITFNNDNKDVEVVVKVCSVAVHNYLTHPDCAFDALGKIHLLQEAEQKAERRAERKAERKFRHIMAEVAKKFGESEVAKLSQGYDAEPKTQRGNLKRSHEEIVPTELTETALSLALSDVLLAVHKTPTGLVTITRDLTAEKFEDLCPSEHKNELSVLWKAFCVLLEEVLIPLADRGLVHPDIRPGFDYTSNILCKMLGEGEERQAVMRIIDYESISNVLYFRRPTGANSWYLKNDSPWNAKTFLLWQCVAIVYAWNNNKKISEMKDVAKEDMADWWKKVFSEDFNPKMEMTMDLAHRLEMPLTN